MSLNNPGTIEGIPSNVNIGQLLQTLDLSDRRDLSAQIIQIDIAFITLVTFIVLLRICTRIFIVGKIFADDVLIVVAATFTLLSAAFSISAATNASLGKHVWVIAIKNFAETIPIVKSCIQHLFITYIMYACAIAFTKLSIISSYLRLIPNDNFRKVMYGTAFIVGGLWLSSIFTIIFQCDPVPAAWDFSITGAKCIVFVDFLWASGALGLFTDLILTFVPIPLFWKLQIPMRQKIVLCLLFCVGSIACVAGIIRLTTLPGLKGGIDITFISVSGTNWSIIECSIGIICVSVPSLRPLITKIWPATLLSRVSTYTSRFTSSSRSGKRFSSRFSSNGKVTQDSIQLGSIDQQSFPKHINVVEEVEVKYTTPSTSPLQETLRGTPWERATAMCMPPLRVTEGYGGRWGREDHV